MTSGLVLCSAPLAAVTSDRGAWRFLDPAVCQTSSTSSFCICRFSAGLFYSLLAVRAKLRAVGCGASLLLRAVGHSPSCPLADSSVGAHLVAVRLPGVFFISWLHGAGRA